jgi:site-specific recombinase XerC
MDTKTNVKVQWAIASFKIADGYTDFILSRQAMQCSPATMDFYKCTTGKFLQWFEERGATSPNELTARYVREYLAELAGRGLADKTVNAHARAIRTVLVCRALHGRGCNLCHAENGGKETAMLDSR